MEASHLQHGDVSLVGEVGIGRACMQALPTHRCSNTARGAQQDTQLCPGTDKPVHIALPPSTAARDEAAVPRARASRGQGAVPWEGLSVTPPAQHKDTEPHVSARHVALTSLVRGSP